MHILSSMREIASRATDALNVVVWLWLLVYSYFSRTWPPFWRARSVRRDTHEHAQVRNGVACTVTEAGGAQQHYSASNSVSNSHVVSYSITQV